MSCAMSKVRGHKVKTSKLLLYQFVQIAGSFMNRNHAHKHRISSSTQCKLIDKLHDTQKERWGKGGGLLDPRCSHCVWLEWMVNDTTVHDRHWGYPGAR